MIRVPNDLLMVVAYMVRVCPLARSAAAVGTILFCLRLHRFYVGSKLYQTKCQQLATARKTTIFRHIYLLHKDREHAFYLCGTYIVTSKHISSTIYRVLLSNTVIQYKPQPRSADMHVCPHMPYIL